MHTDFAALGLADGLLTALDNLGFTTPTPIQSSSLPFILDGRDVVGQAKTGSGKTAAFGLGILQSLDTTRLVPQALILCPTRELADQVAEEVRRLAQRVPNTRITTLCGGRPIRTQKLALSQGAHIIVGTPGRVADHQRRGTLETESLRMVVLDEADRMLDMGFIDEVQGILDGCPSRRQTLLFSATFPDEIAQLSSTTQRNPERVQVDAPETLLLEQTVYSCNFGDRRAMVASLLAAHRPDQALVFCETRGDCDALASFLTRRGAPALALHGGLEQRDRDAVMLQFGNGSTRIVVATNVAARGIDIEALPLVLIAELGGEPEAHVHRVGRTGRAGERGVAVSIVCGTAEERRLADIEAYIGRSIPRGRPPAPADDLSFLEPDFQTVLLLSGRQNKIRKGDVLGALTKDGGIPGDAIGRIDLTPRTTAIALRRDVAKRACSFLQKGRVKNKRVRAILL